VTAELPPSRVWLRRAICYSGDVPCISGGVVTHAERLPRVAINPASPAPIRLVNGIYR